VAKLVLDGPLVSSLFRAKQANEQRLAQQLDGLFNHPDARARFSQVILRGLETTCKDNDSMLDYTAYNTSYLIPYQRSSAQIGHKSDRRLNVRRGP
jgi:hypothetical protein